MMGPRGLGVGRICALSVVFDTLAALLDSSIVHWHTLSGVEGVQHQVGRLIWRIGRRLSRQVACSLLLTIYGYWNGCRCEAHGPQSYGGCV